MSLNVALVGNPNCGKTTLFNTLTGSSGYVGNWPGVTVDKKSGQFSYKGFAAELTDLPGIYSLCAFSVEERIALEYIESESVDVILNVVDATNLERNLFLTLQLIETGIPVVVALNMSDILKKRGDKLDHKRLSRILKSPVVPISARSGDGVDALLSSVFSAAESKPEIPGIYSDATKRLIKAIASHIPNSRFPVIDAVGFINDGRLTAPLPKDEISFLNRMINSAAGLMGSDRDSLITDERYDFIANAVSQCLVKSARKRTFSELIDSVATDRVLAFPVFFAVLFLVFFLAFGPVGSFLSELISAAVDVLKLSCGTVLVKINAAEWLRSLVSDGVLSAVGSVAGFFPQLAILFAALSFLEDSGYMSRAAFITDALLNRFGLSGKAFIPMLMGFGCTVPALMAARTLSTDRDRRITMMITPFMSCSARLPIYGMLADEFFPSRKMAVVFFIYIIGISVALSSCALINRVYKAKSSAVFIMEQPPYRLPSLKSLFKHTGDKLKGFAEKAGTVLILAFAAIWLLDNFSFSLEYKPNNGALKDIADQLVFIIKPLGFGSSRAASALLSGVIAKEAVAGTLSMLTANDLSSVFTAASSLSFMVFTLMYTPCIAAISTLFKEMNSKKYAFLTLAYHFLAAWISAFAVYRIGLLIGL